MGNKLICERQNLQAGDHGMVLIIANLIFLEFSKFRSQFMARMKRKIERIHLQVFAFELSHRIHDAIRETIPHSLVSRENKPKIRRKICKGRYTCSLLRLPTSVLSLRETSLATAERKKERKRKRAIGTPGMLIIFIVYFSGIFGKLIAMCHHRLWLCVLCCKVNEHFILLINVFKFSIALFIFHYNNIHLHKIFVLQIFVRIFKSLIIFSVRRRSCLFRICFEGN